MLKHKKAIKRGSNRKKDKPKTKTLMKKKMERMMNKTS